MNINYIPLSEEALAEYLSSGFIGISLSKAGHSDIHTKMWPNTITVSSLSKSPMPICCEVDVAGKSKSLKGEFNGKEYKLTSVNSPCSVGNIRAIHFASDTLRNEFVSKFGFMEDIALDYFDLTVSPELLEALNASTGLLPDISNNQGQLVTDRADEFNSEFKKALASYSQLVIPLSVSINPFLQGGESVDVPFTLTGDVSLFQDAVAQLSERISVPCPQISLQIVLDNYWRLAVSGRISATSDKIDLVDQLIQSLISEDGHQNKDTTKLISFLEKIKEVFFGMSQMPELQTDDASKVFQYGLYVSLMLTSLDTLIELKNKYKFNNKIEAAAKFLFLVRCKLNQLNREKFYASREAYQGWHKGLLKGVLTKQATLSVSRARVGEGLEPRLDVGLCGAYIGFTTKVLSPYESMLVANLRAKSMHPVRDLVHGGIALKVYEGTNEVTISIDVTSVSGRAEWHEVTFRAGSVHKHGVLAKSKPRQAILGFVSENGVVLGVDADGLLSFSRNQLIGTMDDDELTFHINQLSKAVVLVNSFEF